jgi:hypothetical protein
MRKKDIGTCDRCGKQFEYYLVHNGFNESAYAYCDKCGRSAILDYYSKSVPKGIGFGYGKEIDSAWERWLEPCECGGRYKGGAQPRCPHCGNELSAEAATQYLEANAPGAKGGWRWQRTWRGLYCIVINDRWVEDNWRTAPLSE